MPNFRPNQNEYNNMTPFKTWLKYQINTWGLNSFPFVESDFDDLTNYAMMMKLMKHFNVLIENQNMVEEDMTALYNAFTELQTYLFDEFADYKSELNASFNEYKEQVDGEIEQFETDITADFNELHDFVDNYFDNLDVQSEINNKLDDMVQDGTLQEIISDYLNSKALFGYDNVAGMKQATNLINGSYAKTLGYYAKNDGGMATYKVRTKTNDDVVDEKFIIQLYDTNLIAELIIELPFKPEQIGAKGDGTTDDTSIIQLAINKFNDILLEKIYLVSEIVINKSDIHFNFNVIKGKIKIDSTQLIQFVDLKGTRLLNENGIGLHLVSHNSYGIQYCNFSINLIRANECIKFDSSDGGWINQNHFYKTNVSLGTGITSVALTGNNTYNGNSFVEFGFEDLTKWFNLYTFIETLFEKCRMLPYEADGQGSSVRELGVLNNCRNITFNNKSSGTYYEFITCNNSTPIRITGKAMRAEGVIDGKYMRMTSNGNIEHIEFDTQIFKQNMSDLTGTTIIEIYTYDVSKPLIFNYDTSKYTYVNLRIPDKIASALKYVDIVIIGTMGHSMSVTRNNTMLKEIPANTADTTIRIYF